MSVKISWAPSTYPSIASYDIQVSATFAGSYSFLANVAHNLTGPNYDTVSGTFFYVDSAGLLTNWYRLVSIDGGGNRSVPSAPFEPVSTVPTISNTVKVDHNYGAPGALRYQTAGGNPIEAAIIRIWRKTDFDQGNIDAPLAISITDAAGNWVNPVYLTTGFTYTIQFAKEGLYGPDKVEVIV